MTSSAYLRKMRAAVTYWWFEQLLISNLSVTIPIYKLLRTVLFSIGILFRVFVLIVGGILWSAYEQSLIIEGGIATLVNMVFLPGALLYHLAIEMFGESRFALSRSRNKPFFIAMDMPLSVVILVYRARLIAVSWFGVFIVASALHLTSFLYGQIEALERVLLFTVLMVLLGFSLNLLLAIRNSLVPERTIGEIIALPIVAGTAAITFGYYSGQLFTVMTMLRDSWESIIAPILESRYLECCLVFVNIVVGYVVIRFLSRLRRTWPQSFSKTRVQSYLFKRLKIESKCLNTLYALSTFRRFTGKQQTYLMLSSNLSLVWLILLGVGLSGFDVGDIGFPSSMRSGLQLGLVFVLLNVFMVLSEQIMEFLGPAAISMFKRTLLEIGYNERLLNLSHLLILLRHSIWHGGLAALVFMSLSLDPAGWLPALAIGVATSTILVGFLFLPKTQPDGTVEFPALMYLGQLILSAPFITIFFNDSLIVKVLVVVLLLVMIFGGYKCLQIELSRHP